MTKFIETSEGVWSPRPQVELMWKHLVGAVVTGTVAGIIIAALIISIIEF